MNGGQENLQDREFNPLVAAAGSAIGALIVDNGVGLLTGEAPFDLMGHYSVESAIPRDIGIGILSALLQAAYHRFSGE